MQLFKPMVSQLAIDEVVDTLKSGWTGNGPKVKKVEEKFAEAVGAKYAVALNSCSSAIFLTFAALGIEDGDEIIAPSFTFVATSMMALHLGAKIKFCDINYDTMTADPKSIEKNITEKTKYIIPVAFGGQAPDIDEILKIAKKHKLIVILDCAHCAPYHTIYKNKLIGEYSHAVWSCHSVKILSVGDMGFFTTNDKEVADKVRRMAWFNISKSTFERERGEGKSGYTWDYTIVDGPGYKMHSNDISAAIALGQLSCLKEQNEYRQKLVNLYKEMLHNNILNGKIKIQTSPEYITQHGNHIFSIRIDNRDELMRYLSEREIYCGCHYRPNHHYSEAYGKQEIDLPNTEKTFSKILSLPLHLDLTEDDVKRVCKFVNEFIEQGV